MMNNHPKLTRSLITVATIATLLVTAAPAFAQTPTPSQNGGFFQGLIQFIEQRFGLDKTQVQSAVKDYQSQRNATITPHPTMTQQQMTDREKSRLDKLVSSGKITNAQEQAILTELSSVWSQNMSSMQNETSQQRRTQMQSTQNTLKTWAQSQGINPMYVIPFGGGGMRGGHGMMGKGGHGHWGNPTGAPTPTPGS
jgi:hypothetical protein